MSSPTRPLLVAGVVGPVLFIVVFLIEGATRPGYSAWRHFVSQLATGPAGWMQVANFLVFGSLMLAFAAGLRQALRPGRASIAAPILLGLFGSILIVAGIFVTDPALGYPVGAPPVHTVHGMIHGLAGLAAFTLLPVTCFVMAWRFAGERRSRKWAAYSVVTGVLIIVCFIASTTFATLDATGRFPNAPTGFFQRIAIIGGWTWVAMLALHFVREDQARLRPALARG